MKNQTIAELETKIAELETKVAYLEAHSKSDNDQYELGWFLFALGKFKKQLAAMQAEVAQ